MSRVTNPASGITWKEDGTEIFSIAAAPTTYTDLDLSSIVGAKITWVLIRVDQQDATLRGYGFRPNGDTEFTSTAYGYGVNSASAGGTHKYAWIYVKTAADGIVEWCSNSATNVTLDLIGYWS